MRERFKLGEVFKDNMVFPAKKKIRIFGTCKKNIELKIEFLGTETIRRIKGTEFLIELPAQPLQDKSFSFTVSSRLQKVTIYNCQIGEVFLLTGGANVKVPLKNTFHHNDFEAELDVRFLDLTEANENKKQYSYKQFGKSDLSKHSLLGYLFAKYLYENCKTPISIISFSSEKADVFSWMSPEDIEADDEIKMFVDAENAAKDKKTTKQASLYDKYMLKIRPFAFNGVIYYAGENDYPHYQVYETALRQMIKRFRLDFKQHALPFVIVQIAGYSYPDADDFAVGSIRLAQSNLMKESDRIYITSAVDLGEENSLIPENKVIVANRITNVVMEKIIKKGKNNIPPTYYSYQKYDDRIIIHTNNNYLNLISRSKQNLGFSYTTDGEHYQEVKDIELRGNQIILNNLNGVKEIRYCFQRFPFCDIFTTNELPLLPFLLKIE